MKKLVLLFIGVISMPFVNAQDISDAVRYSNDEIMGTARFRALSGAFGALGGDMSAVSLNPAGSAVFNYSSTSLSVSNMDIENQTSYFNRATTTSGDNFDFVQAGAAFVFNNRNSGSPWRKFVLGFTYDQTGNYDDAFLASGTGNTSIGEFFLANAQGLRLDEISAFDGETIDDAYNDIGAVFGYANQQAFLGYESFILEPDVDDDANTVYTSNIAPGTFNQDYSYVTTGYKGKFGINIAAQYEDNLYLGLNLNSHFINYNRSTFLSETNSNVGSLVTEVGFENNLSTTGNGFSFQLGAISKVTEDFRIGITYDSPTWYTITDETTQYIEALRDEGGNPTWAVVDPQIVNIFPDYKLQTPAKLTGSAALILDKKGFLSFDYSRKDYSKTKFTPEDDSYFADQNNIIANNLKAANTYRFGAEIRQDKLSFRGGYKFEESPYKDSSFYGDLKGFSLGLGYNFGGAKLDLAYENSERTINHQLYEVGLTDRAQIDATNTNLTLTLSMSL
jgi:hypothetical protein